MPYIKKTIIAGKTVTVRKYFAPMLGKNGKRRKKAKLTAEKQEAVNERQAADKLTWLLSENFGVGDVHMVLNYRREYTRTPEEAKKDLERFMRGLRKWCREQRKELRYVTVTEYKRARIHHHLVVPEIPAKDLYILWPYGRPHETPLDDTGDYRKLAEYLLKEKRRTAQSEDRHKKRWNQSRNLRPPRVEYETVQARSWRKDPKPLKGYYIDKDSLRAGVCDVTGYPYQYYTMIQINRRR